MSRGVKQILRSLLRQPGFLAASILTLALGVGAGTALLTIAERVLLSGLPYPSPERLYLVNATLPGPDGNPASFVLSPVEYEALRTRASSLEQVEAMTPTAMALTTMGDPTTVRVGMVSAGFLHLFGLDPRHGRSFTEAEDRARAPVAVLDGSAWARQFDSDPAVVGRTIQLDGVAHEVIGITPPGYQPLQQAIDVWVPLAVKVDPARPATRSMQGVARVRAGVALRAAAEEIDVIQAGIAREYPATHGRARVGLTDMHEALYGSYRPALRVMLTGVGMLLLIACANVANLAIGRLASRRSELGLRLALGASRHQILRSQLLESFLICAAGAIVGLLLALFLLPLILSIYPDALPGDVDLSFGPRTGVIVLALLAVTVLVAGVLPALHAGRTPSLTLDGAGFRQSGGVRDRRMRRWLLSAQVAFAVLLVSAAALVGSSLYRLERVDPGLTTDGVLTLQLAPPARYPTTAARTAFMSRVLEAIAAIPGVQGVGSTQTTWQPLSSMQTRVQLEDRPLDAEENVLTNVRHVTPGYFDVLRVEIQDGRAVEGRDQAETEPVAVVSRAFADRMWPNRDAVGRRLRRTSPNAPWLTVVGVAEDVMDSGLGLPMGPTLYLPYLQQNTPTARIALVVRTAGDPETFIHAVQQAVWAVDPLQPVDQPQALSSAMQATIAQPRFRAFVLSAFGIAAMCLAAVGAYGVAGFSAAARTREMGIRLALGAEPAAVTRLVVRDSVVPAAVGVLAGATLAVLSAPVLRTMLSDGESLSAVVTTTCGVFLLAIVALAAWVPARRCTKREHIRALLARG